MWRPDTAWVSTRRTSPAGSIDFPDALRLVRRRGELMHAAGQERPGTMAAILGLEPSAVEELCAAVREEGAGEVVAANLNSPVQTVISGEVGAVERAMVVAKERGAKRAIRLEVSGAFHSSLMSPAAEGLNKALDEVTIRDAAFPVIANVSAEPVQSADEIRRTLGEQLLSPVHWSGTVTHLLGSSLDVFVEIGSGAVLRGLVRAQERGARGVGVEDPETLDSALTGLRELGMEVAV